MPVCLHCGYAADPGEESCPLCGGRLEPRKAEPAGGAEEAGRVDSALTPWEREGAAFPSDLLGSWWESLASPLRFYGRLDWEDGWARPLLYYLLFGVAGQLLFLLWQAGGMAGDGGAAPYLRGLGVPAAEAEAFLFFLSPFVALLSLVVTAVLVHLGVLLLAPERRGIRATARAACYTSGPAVLQAVPWVGTLVAGLWTLFLLVVGVSRAHRVSLWRAAAAALLVPFGLVVLGVLLALAASALLVGVAGAAPVGA